MYDTDPAAPDVLPIVCAVCRARLHPRAGLLWVALTRDDIRPRPWGAEAAAPAAWRATHYACHPDLDAITYGIELQRACTPRQLALWTAHLADKPWLGNTTWMSLLRTVGEQARLDTGLWFPPAPAQIAE